MILNERLKNYNLILASRSPRRRELMSACGLEFMLADEYEVDESRPDEVLPAEVPLYLAVKKSKAYPGTLSESDILITADTIVLLGSEVLEKPSDREDAIRMLEKLSGRSHTVVSGVTIRSSEAMETFCVKTEVWFRILRREEIEYYIDQYAPYDKAGSYGIQEWIGYVGIGRIEGSFYNVMGLPIQSLYVNLEKFVEKNFEKNIL